MPRQARQLSDTRTYHIMLRGINQQLVLEDREDNEKFLEILRSCKKTSGFKLIAYCLMGNHLHLIIRADNEPLEQIFKRIFGRYAYWYNTKYNRVGHLFQDRFKSEPIENLGCLLRAIRYVHMNPVKAGMVKNTADYPYSSYKFYMEKNGNRLIDVDLVLDHVKWEQFIEYHTLANDDVCMDMTERTYRLTDERAKEIIKKISNCKNVSEFQLLETKERNRYIAEFRKKGMSIRQISRLTGVSKGIVERCKK